MIGLDGRSGRERHATAGSSGRWIRVRSER